MAGGPLWPFSSDPGTSGCIYPNVHIGATNSRREFGMGVKASLAADAAWELRYALPVTLPTGTMTLNLGGLANATAGCGVLSPSWGQCSFSGGSPDTVTLTGEGDSTALWGAGSADQYSLTQVTMDAVTPVGGCVAVVHVGFLGSSGSWTVAQVSTWQAFITWE